MPRSKRPALGSYLEYNGRQIRVTIRVPADLRDAVGATRLKETLPTDSPKLAERLKWDVIAKLRRRIENARSGQQGDPLTAEALLWRSTMPERATGPEQGAERNVAFEIPLLDRAEEIEAVHGTARAIEFHKIASGKAVPLDTHLENWLEESQYTARTKAAIRSAVRRFKTWCVSNEQPITVEGISRKVAGDYRAALMKAGTHHKTANSAISFLSTYWRWLVTRGHARASLQNPWQGQRVAVDRRQTPRAEDGGGSKRPFTDGEVAKILSGVYQLELGGASAALPDMCLVAALTGARIGELAGIRVRHADLDKMELFIAGEKTENAARRIPLHSGLREVMQRRCRGKTPDAFVFHEVPEQREGNGRNKGAPITQAFTRVRRVLGVDDVLDGARQSRIDFHSFRRWFVSKATAALDSGATGYSPWTIADVVGHSRSDMPLAMTMSVYAGRASMETMRVCVEAVKLPD